MQDRPPRVPECQATGLKTEPRHNACAYEERQAPLTRNRSKAPAGSRKTVGGRGAVTNAGNAEPHARVAEDDGCGDKSPGSPGGGSAQTQVGFTEKPAVRTGSSPATIPDLLRPVGSIHAIAAARRRSGSSLVSPPPSWPTTPIWRGLSPGLDFSRRHASSLSRFAWRRPPGANSCRRRIISRKSSPSAPIPIPHQPIER